MENMLYLIHTEKDKLRDYIILNYEKKLPQVLALEVEDVTDDDNINEKYDKEDSNNSFLNFSYVIDNTSYKENYNKHSDE